MESRKITIVSTKGFKKVIMSAATTLAELKADLDANNIDYAGMTFYEGTSKTELKTDASILPHDVEYKGTITNELVFMLTNTNKKIKSGSCSAERLAAYDAIKTNNLQETCLVKLGKNFTMCKTADLVALVAGFVTDPEEDAPICNCSAAIEKLVEYLLDNKVISQFEADEVCNLLNGSASASTEVESSYSDDAIAEMFKDID